MCPPDPQRAHHRQMQRLYLTTLLARLPLLRPVPGPVLRACVFSPGDLLCLFWPPGVKFLVPSRLFLVDRPSCAEQLWYLRGPPFRGAGVETEMSYCTVPDCALVFPHRGMHGVGSRVLLPLPPLSSSSKRQHERPRGPKCVRPFPAPLHAPGYGVRVGALRSKTFAFFDVCRREPPAQAGERLLKQRSDACLFLVWMPRECGHRWLRERGVLRHCARLRPSCAPLRPCVSATTLAYMQQQAAARKALPWFSRPFEGEGVRTGGRLHPGLAGERLLKQRPKPAHDARPVAWVSELDVLPLPHEKTFIDSVPVGGKLPYVCLPDIALLSYVRQLPTIW